MKWEYRVELVDDAGQFCHPDGWKPLSDLGAEGWELVAVVFEHHSEATAFLKRPTAD